MSKALLQQALDALKYHTAQTRPIMSSDADIDTAKACGAFTHGPINPGSAIVFRPDELAAYTARIRAELTRPQDTPSNSEAADARREIGKWLNEEQTKPVDRVALAQLCAGFDALARQQGAAPVTDAEVKVAIHASPFGWTPGIAKWMRKVLENFAASRVPVASVAVPVSLEAIEQYRMQMAGVSTAALGYWKEGDSIHPDYDTLALRDVAKLYAKYDELFKARDATPAAAPGGAGGSVGAQPVQPAANLLKSARAIGEKGSPHSESERLLFEEYMRGHNWKCDSWNTDKAEYYDSSQRMFYAVFRARAAIAQPVQPAPSVPAWGEVEVHTRHIHQNAAELLIDYFLCEKFGVKDAPGVTLEKQGESESESHSWAFWILSDDTTSYLNEDGRIEWCGTEWEPEPDTTPQDAAPVAVEAWRHIANEWADMATNGIQYVKNIRDGITTCDEALKGLAGDLEHCRSVQRPAAPAVAQPSPKLNGGQV